VAALIKDSLNHDAAIEPGGRGEFSVWVDDVKVAEKSRTGFPTEKAVVESVAKAISD
jgi:predicted Rdx family selenoprotein